MKRFLVTLTFYATGFLGCCLVGCGGSNDQIIDDVVQKDGSKLAAPKIGEIGDYLPPLDQDRVQIAPPKGWYTLPRSSKYLICFARQKGATVPKIVVTVEPCDKIDEVTTENLSEYVKLLDDPGENLQRRRIEDFIGISYIKQGTIKTGVRTILVDRKFLDTIVDHRRYRFELRAEKGNLEKYMPELLAVAVRTKFSKRKSPKASEEVTAKETKDETKDKPKDDAKKQPPKAEPAPAKPKPAQPKPVQPEPPKEEVEKTKQEPKAEKPAPPEKPSRRRRTSQFD